MPKVFNKHHKDYPPDAVYVGRPSEWGNPFSLDPKKKGRDRAEVIEQYKAYALSRFLDPSDSFAADLVELRGRDLLCWCHPKECHADFLLELANG